MGFSPGFFDASAKAQDKSRTLSRNAEALLPSAKAEGSHHLLIFHHHSSHRQAAGVADRKRNRPHPKLPAQHLGSSAQCKNGTSSRLALDLELIPGDSPADPGSECLRSGLFGGEPSGEAFRTGSL